MLKCLRKLMRAKRKRAEEGQSMVEFAILLPVLILLLLVPVDLYRYANYKMILKSAASESLGQVTYADVSLGLAETSTVLQDVIREYYGDKLDVGFVAMPVLTAGAGTPQSYTYYVYNSDKALDNPTDFQAQFDSREAGYEVVTVQLQLSYPFEPITFWGAMFVPEGSVIQTPVYQRNVYMKGDGP